MNYINSISSDNFEHSFNLTKILSNSVFYPASGLDAIDIECFQPLSNSYIHVDYSLSEEEVRCAMRTHFKGVGYKLIGIKNIALNELNINTIPIRHLALSKNEMHRLDTDFISEKYNYHKFTPYALWAVYELDSSNASNRKNKIKKFSLLHIGGEACASYKSLYFNTKTNPIAVTLKRTGAGYGDNWTNFYDQKSHLFKAIISNFKENNVQMPKFILSDILINKDKGFPWTQYHHLKKCPIVRELTVYTRID